MFQDRKDAGQKLAVKLGKYKGIKDGLVIGLPRGGVVVAYEIAKALNLPLDVIIVAKLGAPGNPELAIGALAGNVTYLDEEIIESLGVSKQYIQEEINRKKKDIERKQRVFHREKPPKFAQKTVIIVDDGMATGSTMEAAVHAIKNAKPNKIILAVPVSPPETLEKFRKLADEIICLIAPAQMFAVGQFYDSFPQTEDEEVIELLKAKG